MDNIQYVTYYPFTNNVQTHYGEGVSRFNSYSFTAIHHRVVEDMEMYQEQQATAPAAAQRRVVVPSSGEIGVLSAPVGDGICFLFLMTIIFAMRIKLNKRALTCALALLLLLPMAYAVPFKGGDTISISYQYNTLTSYYLTAQPGDDKSLSYTKYTNSDSLTANALWRIKDVNEEQMQFQNLGTGTYLKVKESSSGWYSKTYTLVTTTTSSNATTLTSFNATNSKPNDYIQTNLRYAGTNTRYISCNSSGAWSMVTNTGTTTSLRLQRWTAGTQITTEVAFDGKVEFGIWSDNYTEDGANEPSTVTCRLSQEKYSFVYNVSNPSQHAMQHEDDQFVGAQKLYDSGARFSLSWLSNLTHADDSHPTESWLREEDYTHTEKESRPMLSVDDLTPRIVTLHDPATNTDRSMLQFTITPRNHSPHGLVKNEEHERGYVPYVDYLRLTITEGDSIWHHDLYVHRVTYHTQSLPELSVRLRPVSYNFSAKASTPNELQKEVETQITIQQGTQYLYADGQVAHTIYIQEPAIISSNWDKVTLSAEARNAEDTGASDWLTVAARSGQTATQNIIDEPMANNQFTMLAAENSGSSAREALLKLQFKYNDGSHTYTSEQITTFLSQVSDAYNNGKGGERQYGDTIGIANIALKGDGQQATHQLTKTVYFTPAEEITLQLQERSFFGFQRWYDNSGHDPYYRNFAENGNHGFAWKTQPQAKVGNETREFTNINANAEHNHGKFGYYNHHFTAKNAGNIPYPVFTAWNDTLTHDIYCALSNYTDGNFSVERVVCPTLSKREHFRFIPAHHMARELAKTTNREYYETHQCYASTNRAVHLRTNFRHTKSTYKQDFGYYYFDPSYDKDYRHLKSVGNTGVSAMWFKNGERYTPTYEGEGDDIKVNATIANSRDIYDLRAVIATGDTLFIARFIVDYLDNSVCGPRSTEIISDAMINEHYVHVGNKIDFNTLAAGEETKTIGGTTFRTQPLDWDETSYGFFYPQLDNKRFNPDNTFPYWGEYALVDYVNKDWAKGENHGGKAKGYALYVDGSLQPGNVVSLVADGGQICSGQKMYCSAWVCNPCPTNYGGANPIFQFIVEGLEKGEDASVASNWKEVGIFLTGEIEKNSGWQQVVFPVHSSDDYDKVRVTIRNFAANNTGNDFLIDDVQLYAEKIPIRSYEANSTCADENTLMTIIRIDYTDLGKQMEGEYLYYEVYDQTQNAVVPIGSKGYHVADLETPKTVEGNYSYGSLIIPYASYDPSLYDAGNPATYDPHIGNRENGKVYPSIADFVETTRAAYGESYTEEAWAKNPMSDKGYVKEIVRGEEHWIIYILHILHTRDEAHPKGVNRANAYVVRMAESPADLYKSTCALTAELPFQSATHTKQDGGIRMDEGSTIYCSNKILKIEMALSFTDAAGNTKEGTCLADWLEALPSDTLFTWSPTTMEEIENNRIADSIYVKTYGYSRYQVLSALKVMRVQYNNGNDNPNYNITDITQLQRAGFDNETDYDLIIHLHALGKLQLRKQSAQIYVLPEETSYWWIYPIMGTSETKDDETIEVCDHPQWLTIKGTPSPVRINLGAIPLEEMTESEKHAIPGVRVLPGELKDGVTITIQELTNGVFAKEGGRLIATTDPALGEANLQGTTSARYTCSLNYVEASKRLTITPDNLTAHPLRAGYEYTYELPVNGKEGVTTYVGCETSNGYLTLKVLEDTVVWKPSHLYNNLWNDDANWRGISGKDTLALGHMPIGSTRVIIPDQTDYDLYPLMTEATSIDHNFTPNTCKNIQIRANAMIGGQHLLQYDSAYVQLSLPTNDWYAVASPLQDVYAGDLYHREGETLKDFGVAPLDFIRGITPTAYHIYGSYYNTSVTEMQYGYDPSSNTHTDFTATAATWQRSNALDNPINSGGVGVLVFDPAYSDNTKEVIIPLPKPQNEYKYVSPHTNEYIEDGKVTLGRTNAHKLSLGMTDSGEGYYYQDITLVNGAPDTKFMFGNPALSYINMMHFLQDNSDILEQEFEYVSGSAWYAATPLSATDPEQITLPPMRAALLHLKSGSAPAKNITVRLKDTHLTLYPSGETPLEVAPARATHRAKTAVDPQSHTMRIEAYNDYCHALIHLCTNAGADNGYRPSEDARLIYSEDLDNGNSLNTPMALYTLAQQDALLEDVRREITTVPLCLSIADAYKTPDIRLHFSLTDGWYETLWLCDALTGERQQIYDGQIITVPTPRNNERRYYLQSREAYEQEQGGNVSTGIGSTVDSDNVWLNTCGNELTVVADLPIQQVVVCHAASGIVLHDIQPMCDTRMLILRNLPAGVVILRVTTASGVHTFKQIVP